jgi:hypothetical protein
MDRSRHEPSSKANEPSFSAAEPSFSVMSPFSAHLGLSVAGRRL